MSLYLFKTNSLIASFKDADAKQGIVTGYFSSFNNVDSDGDIIRKGAFVKSIMENGPGSAKPRIKHLLNHNTTQPLGKILVLKEDDKGLYYESKVGTHALGVDFIKKVESELITEHSIGFKTIKRNQLQDWESYMKTPALGMYEITEAQLWEGSSLDAWGANENTPLTGLKGKEKEDVLQKIINRQKNIEKFCRNSDATDETVELLLLESKQLTQMIIDISTAPEVKTTQPVIDITGLFDTINNFNKQL